jgi:hypothetical protein
MKRFHLLARPLAATAVVGIAFIGFAGTAGASTVSASVPGMLGGTTSNPVVNVGSGSVPPVPGTTATVPAHGHDDVQVDNPNVVSTGSSDPTGLSSSANGNLVSEHSSIDACVAAALLTNRSPNGCGAMADGSSSVAQSISSIGDAPSLADSLSNVGACARLAVADGQPVDTCSKSEITPITTAPPSTTVPTIDDQVNRVLADNGLCPIVQQLSRKRPHTGRPDTGDLTSGGSVRAARAPSLPASGPVVELGNRRQAGELEVGHEAELLHAAEASEPAQGDAARIEDADPFRQRSGRVTDREQLTRPGRLAQPRRHVGGPADVVVTVEDQDATVCQPAAQREAMTFVPRDELGGRGNRRSDLDADEHRAVAEPLRDADAPARRELSCQRAEAGQRLDRGVLAVVRDEARESAEVHERERALDERDRVGELARLLGATRRRRGPDGSVAGAVIVVGRRHGRGTEPFDEIASRIADLTHEMRSLDRVSGNGRIGAIRRLRHHSSFFE